jgi:hypothetical protein
VLHGCNNLNTVNKRRGDTVIEKDYDTSLGCKNMKQCSTQSAV